MNDDGPEWFIRGLGQQGSAMTDEPDALPPVSLRLQCRQHWQDGIDHIAAIARGDGIPKPTPAHQIAAWTALAKFGLGTMSVVSIRPDANRVSQAAVKVVKQIYGTDRLDEFTQLFSEAVSRSHVDEPDPE